VVFLHTLNTYSRSQKQATECAPCHPGELSGPGSIVCSACVPSPFDSENFSCYSTQSKIIVVLAWCLLIFLRFITVLLLQEKRKADLEERGMRALSSTKQLLRVQCRFSLSPVLKVTQICHKILSRRCRNHHPERYFDEVHLELQEQVTAW
jgi:hypothetical protein